MKSLKTLIPAAIVSCLLVTTVFADQDDSRQSGYTLNLYNDCQLVAQHAMDDKQVTAYLALKSEEEIMRELESPIADIQAQLDDYSLQIEELTALAVQETDNSVYVDKHYLAQQKEVVNKLNHLMAKHQSDFDALGVQGRRIGKLADAFTTSIKPIIGNDSFDQIHVSSLEQTSGFQCQGSYFAI